MFTIIVNNPAAKEQSHGVQKKSSCRCRSQGSNAQPCSITSKMNDRCFSSKPHPACFELHEPGLQLHTSYRLVVDGNAQPNIIISMPYCMHSVAPGTPRYAAKRMPKDEPTMVWDGK